MCSYHIHTFIATALLSASPTELDLLAELDLPRELVLQAEMDIPAESDPTFIS